MSDEARKRERNGTHMGCCWCKDSQPTGGYGDGRNDYSGGRRATALTTPQRPAQPAEVGYTPPFVTPTGRPSHPPSGVAHGRPVGWGGTPGGKDVPDAPYAGTPLHGRRLRHPTRVPRRSTPTRRSPLPGVHTCQHPSRGEGINLNTATRDELEALPGVGVALAGNIISARPIPPGKSSALLAVPHLGRKTLAKMEPHLCPCFRSSTSGPGAGPIPGPGVGSGAGAGAGAGVEAVGVTLDSDVAGPLSPEYSRQLVSHPILPGWLRRPTEPQLLPNDPRFPGVTCAGLTEAQARAPQLNLRRCGTSDPEGFSTLLVASWNVRHMSDREGLRLDAIARVIAQFDVVAVQEVRTTEVVEHLCTELNRCCTQPVWRCYVSAPAEVHHLDESASSSDTPHHHSHKERYAFFWQSHRAELIGKPMFVRRKDCSFAREPYWAYFRSVPSPGADGYHMAPYDFIIVTIHVVFGDAGDGQMDARRAEVASLQHLIAEVRQDRDVQCDVMVMGDFNMGLAEARWRRSEWQPLITAPTTIYESAYDNICMAPSTVKKQWAQNGGVLDVDHVFYPDTALEYGTEAAKQSRKLCNHQLSDHRPVWVQVHAPKAPPSAT